MKNKNIYWLCWLNFLVIFNYFDISAQELKKQTNKLSNVSAKEIFYVLKENRSIRHGDYKIEDTKGLIRVVGLYDNNRKIGKWEFYDEILSGTAVQKFIYDYDTNKVIFYGISGNLQKTIDVKTLSYQETYDFIPAFYSEGTLMFTNQLFDIFDKMKNEKVDISLFTESTAYIKFQVNKAGELKVAQVLKSFPNLSSERLQYFIEQILPKLSATWIPKTLKDGNTEDSFMTLPIKFK
jgi:hypothetical protein